MGIGANMVRSTDTTAAQSAALIAAHAALTGYLLVHILVLNCSYCHPVGINIVRKPPVLVLVTY